MRLTISIETSGSGFEENQELEISRILSVVAKNFYRIPLPGDEARLSLRDINGNTVGFARFED